MQWGRQLAAEHCLVWWDTSCGVDDGMLPEKELAEAEFHGAFGVLDKSLPQLSNVAFSLTIRGDMTGGRCNDLDTIFFRRLPESCRIRTLYHRLTSPAAELQTSQAVNAAH